MKLYIDINCDLGEGYGAFRVGNDAEIMPHITSANVACGFHAGDPVTMAKTVSLARENNVAVGAHPSYPDIMGFGRREMQFTREEVMDCTIYQIGALQGFARAAGVKLQHVKLHGALYNKAAKDEETSEGVVEAVKTLDDKLIIFALPQSVLSKIAAEAGLRVVHEFFADRAYNADGGLVSRKQRNAIVKEPRKVVERVLNVVREKKVLATNGKFVTFGEIHTICVHSDTPEAVTLVEMLKKALTKAGIEVERVGSFI